MSLQTPIKAFTFYYIYIKTEGMYVRTDNGNIFTFYYIYIKTEKLQKENNIDVDLHSIIFILKRYSFCCS